MAEKKAPTYEPKTLHRASDDQTVVTTSAEHEAKLRWDGFRTAPAAKAKAVDPNKQKPAQG